MEKRHGGKSEHKVVTNLQLAIRKKQFNNTKMNFDLDKSLEILERTPGVLKNLLAGLSDDWTMVNEGGETWSAYDVVGHLIHGEKTDWIERIEKTLGENSDRNFKTFDRFAQFTESKGKTLEQLLNEFAELRKKNLVTLKSKIITADKLKLKGVHPKFGEVTLEQLLSTWTVHDLTHIAQITRVMAKQYRENVGPWLEFFTLLQK